jgi:DNA mismatch endonuclease (patch repair protein)
MKVVFINGCFWHSHSCRWGQVVPATNLDFWLQKRAATVARDHRNIGDLRSAGWKVVTVWECELKDTEKTISQIVTFLES